MQVTIEDYIEQAEYVNTSKYCLYMENTSPSPPTQPPRQSQIKEKKDRRDPTGGSACKEALPLNQCWAPGSGFDLAATAVADDGHDDDDDDDDDDVVVVVV